MNSLTIAKSQLSGDSKEKTLWILSMPEGF